MKFTKSAPLLASFVMAAAPLLAVAADNSAPTVVAQAGATASASTDAAAPAAAAPTAPTNAVGISMPAGHYKCELNRNVQVRDVSPDLQTAVLHWDKKEYAMKAVETRSGALRFEHPASGLAWIVIVGKSMLLDTKLGRQLANECRS